jgi:hypothetical protein
MDAIFLPAAQTIRGGDTRTFSILLQDNPQLARQRSEHSHPTLMQCLVLDGSTLPEAVQRAMATTLLDAGSPVEEPLIATGSIGNVVLAGILLDHGAALNGTPQVLRGWSVLEEALYWGETALVQMLLQRGASLHNLRIAAALGKVEHMSTFLDAQGELADPVRHAINTLSKMSSGSWDCCSSGKNPKGQGNASTHPAPAQAFAQRSYKRPHCFSVGDCVAPSSGTMGRNAAPRRRPR